MIVIGSAVFDPVKDTVSLDTKDVAGFNTVVAVRLTNYTSDVLVLTNINGRGQGQEYLMPLQQMVYLFPNVTQVPLIRGLQLGADIPASALLVEWSLDVGDGAPDTDFPGTYPTQVTAPATVGTGFAILASVHTFADTITTFIVPANPKRVTVTLINQSSGGQNILFGGSSDHVLWDDTTTALMTPGAGLEFSSQGPLYFRAGSNGAKLAVIEETFP